MQFKINLIWVCIVAVGALFFLRECENSKEAINLYEAAQDTLTIERTKNGLQMASITSLTGKNDKLFLQMKTKDSTIIWLQGSVKKYKGKVSAAAVLSSVTTEQGSTVTIIHDTIEGGSPVYFTKWIDKWSSGSITASKDSIQRNIIFTNDFEVIIGASSNGWFKKRETTLQVLNLNPNTSTTSARSFIIKNERKRLNFGLSAGCGVNLLTFKPVSYVGVGANYTLFSIK